jgi:hypothetical protein
MGKSVLVGVAILLFAGSVQAQQRESRAAAAPDAVVSIRTDNGDVTVTGWDGDEVVVRTRGQSRSVRITGVRTRLFVRAEDDEPMEVRVPRRVRVDVHTQAGDVNVSDVSGSVYLESLSGDFRVAGEPHLVEIEGVSGDITILGRPKTVNVNTTSGDIHLPHASGTVDASTTSGDITVSSEGLERGEFSSTSGIVTFQGSPARNASLYFDSVSGTIELRLDRNFAADYDISAVTGEIENTFGPRPTRLRTGAGTFLRFETGAGARVRAVTVSGSVRLGGP